MNLPATPINVIYVEPKEKMSDAEKSKQLTRFISLIAQVGFRELALNPDNSTINFDENFRAK